MKHRRVGIFAILAASGALALQAAETTLSGYLSDANCGAKDAVAAKERRDCAEKCIKGGSDAVLVTKEGKVYKLSGKVEAAKALVQHHLKVKGSVDGDVLTITSVEKAD